MQRSAIAFLRLRSLSAASSSLTPHKALSTSGCRFSTLRTPSVSQVDLETTSTADSEPEKKGQELWHSILKNVKHRMDVREVVKDLQTLSKVKSPVTVSQITSASKNVSSPISRLQELQEFESQGKKLEILMGYLVYRPAVESLDAMAVLGCMSSLAKMGLSRKDFVVQSLQNELTWRARSMAMKDLSIILNFCVKRSQKDYEMDDGMKKLRDEITRTIQSRWVEIEDSKTIVSMMYLYPEGFNDGFMAKLEDRTMERVESMTAEDLIAILKVLAIKKRRMMPLLKKINYHLNKYISELDIKTLSEGFFSLRQLTFKNVEMLEEFCDAASRKVDGETDNEIIWSFLMCMGQLLFLHKPLLDKMTALLVERVDSLDTKYLLGFLMTTASLNYFPPNSDALFKVIAEKLKRSSLEGERADLIWLDVVWSLSILGMAETHHLESVLSTKFYNKLLYTSDHRNVGVVLKLLNVNAVASFCTPDYKGPTINVATDPLLKDVRTGAKSKSQHVESVIEAFSSLAMQPNYLSTNVNTHMGFIVQGECIFDKNTAKPLALEGKRFFSDQVREDSLPTDAVRVALMAIDYNDCLLGGSGLSGLSHLSKKLLEARGFQVLQAKHTEIKPNMKNLDKIKLLEQNLKKLLNT